MPRVITGNSGRRFNFTEATRKNYKYNYPNNLPLKPGDKLHDTIVTNIIEYAAMSQGELSTQFDRWRKIDNVLTAYIPQDEEEEKVKYADSRKPTSVVFPYTYSIMDALLTYMVMAFIQDPIFRYEAVSGENYAGGVLLEAVVAQQCRRSKVALSLHTLFRDAFAYSRGYVVPAWEVKSGMRSGLAVSEGLISGAYDVTTARERLRTTLFEGNTLYNINPYLALPDPNVSAARVQDGEFFGWIEGSNLMSLLGEEVSEDRLFNIQYLRHVNTGISQFMSKDAVSANDGRIGTRDETYGLTSPIDLVCMYIKLIPSEWGLSDSNYPETWWFKVAADSILIQAEKLDYDHGMMPVVAAVPDDDGRSSTPVSKLETLYGLQEVGDWLFNSHMTNVRKSINNMLIVDPQMINMNDLRDPKPGKLVRLLRPAWGRGVDGAVKQLKVDDITRGNIGETSFIQSAMQAAMGTDNSMMGVLRQGGPERLTKGEFQGTRNSATSRLERTAMIIGLQAMQDLGRMFASNTQQFMSEATYVKIADGLENELAADLNIVKNKVRVNYTDLLIDYDVIVRDGSIPGGNFSESWIELFNILGSNPELGQRFDLVRIFTHIAHHLGAKNVDDFKVKVVSDQQAAIQAQEGNYVPAGV